MRILFVDDCADDILLATAVLRRAGVDFEYGTAATLAEAREALGRGRWTAIICDYNLGPNTALDVLLVARECCPDVPFLLFSGTIGEERAAEAIRQGAADYVMKDRAARLAAALRRELAAAEARRTSAALEARLRAVEERYRKTFERAPIGIGNTDTNGVFISVNARFCEILGYSPEDLLGRRFGDFSEDSTSAMSHFEEILRGAQPTASYESRYVRKDGGVALVDVTLAPVRDKDGALEYVIALLENITERKNAQEKLIMQARLLECVDQAVMATDLAGRVIFWNSFAERLYGWSAAEAFGRSIVELTSLPEMYEEAAEVMQRLQQGESWTGEVVLRRRDGSTFPALIIDAPLFDEHGALIGIVGVSHDLTAQKSVESELRERRLQLAEAQEIARVGSWTYDFTTATCQWSDALLRVYGGGAGEPLTLQEALARVHPDDRAEVKRLYAHASETFQPTTANVRVITGAGQRDVLMRSSFVLDGAGKPIKAIGIVQDVTEARQLEAELRRRTIQQTAVAELGHFALSGASTRFIVDQAIVSMNSVLAFDCAAVLQRVRGELVHVAGDPCPSEMNLRVPIHSADGSEWGILGGTWMAPHAYEPYDVEFLRSIATVVGQALDREAADTELRTLAQQQGAIAEMGRLVLTSVDQAVLQRACELLMFATGADYAFIAELTGRDVLTVRAGHTWTDLPEVSLDSDSQAADAIRRSMPAVADDYRLHPGAMRSTTVPYGVLSGVMVPVASATRTYGLLSAQSHTTGCFRPADVEFMQTMANILAEAMERENARLKVEESEQRYRRIFEGATEIIFSLDPKGRFTTLSSAFETITGWRREEWLGRPFTELIVPEDRERTLRDFREMLGEHITKYVSTALLGRERRVMIEVASFVRAENGVAAEIYGFARDVTDARRATAERERLTRSLQLLLESTVEGIYTIDVDGRCTMVNRAAAAFLGRTPEDLLGRSVHELLHAVGVDGESDPEASCPVHAVLHDGEARTVSNDVFTRKDGTLIPVAYSAAPIIDNGQRVGAVVTFTDLTERRKLEAKLEQANRLSSLGRLAATVAHEFNNVLMGIAPFIDVIRRAPEQKISGALDHIGSAVKRGRRITEDILRFTQPAEPVRTSVDVDVWMHALGVEARSLLGPAYSLIIDAQSLWIDADPNQLHQIFLNLVLNARDAMPRGGAVTLTARRERREARFPFGAIDDPSRYAHLIASDTGCGMNEETLRHAFEPLFTTKRNGTGLGLAVTHQVVRRHGGEIFIESAPGAGTAFHIFLPLGSRPAATVMEPADERSQRSCREILLVEDDPLVSTGLRTILECEGFAVRMAMTGREALDTLAAAIPDAVILDVGLPDMDGKAVFAAMRARHSALPVVFSTGHSDRGSLEELLTGPNSGYLLKPYESAELLETLAEVMSA